MNHSPWIAFLLASTVAAPALAAEPTKAEIAVARQYFDAAAAAESQGRWRDAIEQLNKAIAIKDTAGLRYHLGFARENLGLLAEAMLEYQRAASLVHAGMATEEAERFIFPKLDEMRRRVPTLTVTLPPDIKSAQLQVDGAPVKSDLLGTPIPLNPGAHALVVFASGRRPFHVQVTLSEGSAVTQAAELVPEVGGAATPPAQAPLSALPTSPRTAPGAIQHEPKVESSASPARTWVLIGEAAIAAAGLGVGFAYLAAAGSAQTRFDDANARIAAQGAGCLDSGLPDAVITDCQNLRAAFSERRRDNNLTIAGFVGAGLGASALVATLILWKTSPQVEAGLSLVPRVGASGASLALRWAH